MAKSRKIGSQAQLRQLQAVVDALHDTMHAATLDDALYAVVKGVRKVLGEEATAAITLLDDGGKLDPNTYRVDGPLTDVLKSALPRRSGGIGAWVVERDLPVFENDVRTEADNHPAIRQDRVPVGAYACLPLHSNDRVVGTLFVVFPTPFEFSDQIKSGLEPFISLSAHAVELTYLRVKSDKQREEQTRLVRRISQQLLATWQEQQDPVAALQNTLDAILQQLQTDVFGDQIVSASVYIFDDERGFYSGAAQGPLQEYMVGFPPRSAGEGGTALHAVKTREPLFVADMSSVPDHVPALSERAIDQGVRAFANLPLVVGSTGEESVVGILIINLQTPYEFSENRKAVLRLFADQAAIALQAARVHRRRLREQRALEEMGRSAATGSLDAAGAAITRQAVLLTSVDYGSFWYLDAARSQLVLKGVASSQSGWPLPTPDTVLPVWMSQIRSINRHVFETGLPYYAPDLTDDPYHLPWDERARSAFCLPLFAESQPFGTLYLASERQDAFSEESRIFLRQVLVPHAEIALNNARLLERANAFQAIVAEVHSTYDLSLIGDKILQQLGKVIPVRTASLQVIFGNQRRLIAGSGFDIATADPYLTRPLSEDPVVADLINQKKTAIVPDVSQVAGWCPMEGVKSWCGVPLVADNKVVGLLTLDHSEVGFYREDLHRNLLASFADHAALALRDAQRNRDLETLSKFALDISAVQDEKLLYQTLVEAVVSTLECSYCTVFLAQADGTLVPVPEGCGGTMFKNPPQIRLPYGKGLAGRVYQDGKPLVTPDTSADARYVPGPGEPPIRPRSNLSSPLRKADAVIGAISADFDRIAAFGDDDLRLLETICGYASVALQNIENQKDLRTVHDAAVNLSQQPNLHQIYKTSVETVATAVRCSHSTLFVSDRKKLELIPVDRVGGTTPASTARHFRRGEGLAGIVFATGQALLVNDASQDERFVEGNVSIKDEPRSVIIAPVRADGEVIGVLSADKDEINGFTHQNLRTLETLALDVGIAIKARRLQDRLEAVSQFQRAVSDLVHLSEQLEQIHKQLSENIDTSGLYVALYDPESEIIEFPKAFQDGTPIADDIKVDRNPYAPRRYGDPSGLTEWVIKRRRSLLVEDVMYWTEVGREEIASELIEGLKSCLVTPMIAEGKVIGAIGLQNFQQPSAYTADDRDFLTAIANSAAIALENAKKYDQINNRLDRQIKELQAISKFQEKISGIGSYKDEVQDIFQNAVEVLQDVVSTRYLAIAIYDAQKDLIQFPLAYSDRKLVPDSEKIEGMPYGPRQFSSDRGLTRYVMEHREPLLVFGEFDQWLEKHATEVSILKREHAKCWLGAPMVLGEHVFGAIILQDAKREGIFDEQHKQLVATVARQAAVVLENAQKYDHLKALGALQKQLSAVVPVEKQLENIYQATASTMAGLMDTRNMYIALYDAATDTVEFPLYFERGRLVPNEEKVSGHQAASRRLGKRKGLTGWVIEHREPLLINKDFDRETERLGIEVFSIGTKCWLGAPMMLRGEAIGVIGLQNFKQEKFYNEGHRDLLTTIAGQAAIAIENARQYDLINNQLARRIKELEAVSRFQQAISRVDLGQDQVV